MSLHTLTLFQAHHGMQSKEFSCSELVESCLNAIASRDEAVHAYLTVTEDIARASAQKVDEKIHRGIPLKPLEGIPAAVKDVLMMAGIRTTAGSKILEHYVATYDATVIKKLKKEGVVFLGKTNLDEFAMGASTENSAFGPTRNPWDLSRVPGGSSGGSAAAVAADECIFSLGSDTGGSIRQPAGFCGVTGLKPTYGAVSRYGLIAMASSLDQIGPFAKTAQDAAWVFDAIRGSDPYDSSSHRGDGKPVTPHLEHSIHGLRIGIPNEYFIDGMDADVERLVRDALDVLQTMGCELFDISLPHTQYGLAAYYINTPAEVSANMARYDGIRYGYSSPDAANLMETYCQSRGRGLGKEVQRRIMLGTYVLAAGYYDAYYKKAQKVRHLLQQDFMRAFRSVDCIVTPTSPGFPFRIGEKANDPLTMYLADIFTVPASLAGIPGVSVPCGFVQREQSQLPVGMQLLGPHFGEEVILRVGHQYQRETGWHTQKPQLAFAAV